MNSTYAVLGSSFLWPWNALITASSLAASKLSPGLYASYSSTVMTTSSLVSLVASFYFAWHPHSYRYRVVIGEVVIAAAFLLLAFANALFANELWMISVVLVTVLSSSGCAAVQNGVLAITQRIPNQEYSFAMLNGQAVAGVLPATVPLIASIVGVSTNSQELALLTFLSVSMLSIAALLLFMRPENRQFVNIADSAADDSETERELEEEDGLISLFWRLQVPCTAILAAFIVSLSYPVFANRIESHVIPQHYFAPITHLIWNLGDLGGRLLCSQYHLEIVNSKTMSMYAVGRFGFLVVLLIAAWMGNPSDFLYLSTMAAFGITNGHLVSSAIALAPSLVQERLQLATGGLIGLVIATGLVLGSLVSFIVVMLI